MAEVFKLPEIGEGVIEGEIVEWHVKAGDTVIADQPLVSVLTDKATVEIAATFSGQIRETKGNPGDMVLVEGELLTYALGALDEVVPEAPKNTGQTTAPQGTGKSIIDFPLPEIGEGVMEGELVEWLVKPGDFVQRDSPVVSVLTDKATVEITSPCDGVVTEQFGKPGDLIEVGNVLMKLATEEELRPGEKKASVPEAPKQVAPSKPVAQVAPVSPSPLNFKKPSENPSISAFGTPLATPAVRRLAAANGLDLAAMKGSGPNHRITRADVVQAMGSGTHQRPAEPGPVAVAVASLPSGDTRERIRGLRKAIYASMTKSKKTVPHFTYVDEVEMDRLVSLRGDLKAPAEAQGIKLTFLPFILKAVVQSLKKYPILNASVDDEAGEIVYHGQYNIGIATATPGGLTVPVLKNADQKSIIQIAEEIAALSGRAREKKSTMDDISGGTFTLTSLGRLGGLMATPIINHPEVGIMGIHNLQERAVVRQGQIVIRHMMNISVSFDHRIVDGDVGATFAQEVKAYLEEPGKLMLNMT